MADYEQPPGDGEESIEVPDDRTESEREYDRQIERLDTFFSSVQPGVTLLIERLKPSWCAGLLEEITVGDEVIDLQYFIETWGGKLLSVKIRGKGGRLQGSYKVPLHSYPPLRWGERIYPADRGDRFREKEEPQQQQNPVVVHPPAPSKSFETVMSALPALLPIALKYFERQEERRREDMALMLEMSRRNSGGGISDISQIGTIYSQLSEVFKNQGGGGGGDDIQQFIPQALDVLKMVLQPGQGTQKQDRGKLSPLDGGPPVRPTQLTPPKGAPPAMSSSSSTPATPRDVSDDIAGMDPRDAAGTIIEALGKMDAGKRDAAITSFLTEFQSDMESDDVEGVDDDNNEGYPMSN